jgi:Zn-dependent M28 family amino/carboxypeptidase
MRPLTRWLSSLSVALITLASSGCVKPPPPLKPPRFDQERAFHALRELCDLGPRNHGSKGKSNAENWIQQQLRKAGAKVELHEFQHTPKGDTKQLSFRNIVGRINPQMTRRVLIATHYDTRATADKDPDEARRNEPIIGANDGASGVAVLLEMAATWKEQPPPVGVDLIFFDGEDFGRGTQLDDYFLGSKAWVREFPDYRPEWGVVLDMVGDADFTIRKERDSLARAPVVVDRLWSAAVRVGAKSLLSERGGLVRDDHTAFLDHGVPVVLLIDFSYSWFHTTGDTADKCSPASLGDVGRTVMEAVEAP